MKKVLTVICTVVLIVISGCSPSTQASKDTVKTESVAAQLVDTSQFSRISPEALVGLLGKAESIEDWIYSSPNGHKYPAKTYIYNKGNYEFLVIDNNVVRFTFYCEGKTFQSEKELFALFGIVPRDDMKKVADTGTVLRYQSVSDKIGEFLVLLKDKNSLDTIKVTYNLNYFN